jgi:transcriptional antiterminator RfaH
LNDIPSWAVVHAASAGDVGRAAREAQELGGFESYVPRYKEHYCERGWNVRQGLLFARYFFVRHRDDICFTLRNLVRGITGVVLMNERPCLMHDSEIAGLRRREDRDGFIWLNSRVSFSKGQKVRVAAGAFAGLRGVHSGMRENDREVVLLTMLGARRRVPIPTSALVAA